MNKLMYRFVATRKKKKKEIDPFLDTVCPFRASRVKRNRPVFRHGMPPRGIPRNQMMLMFLTGRGKCVPSLAIYPTRMDFDWPAFVEDNQKNTSRLGEGRV